MNDQEFIDLVYAMRQAQKDYFKTRSKQALERSKRLEAEVDQVISSRKAKQLSLL